MPRTPTPADQATIDLNCAWAETVFSCDPDADLPFSFVYGGRGSSDLIHAWKRVVHDEETCHGTHRRILTITDPETGLEVRAVVRVYTDTAGVDWTIYFTNTGDVDTPILEQVRSLDVSSNLSEGDLPVLHRLAGTSLDYVSPDQEFYPMQDSLPSGAHIGFAPSDGRSSDGISPFFNTQWADGGMITAVGWTGQWCASVEHGDDHALRVQAGMENMRLMLHPGETIRTPRILQVRWSGTDHLDSYNLFRRTMLAHVTPRVNGEVVVPPIGHLTTVFYEGLAGKSSESAVMSYIEPMKELGFEAVWLDAYWMRNWGMGDYGFPTERVQDPVGFPRGLRPIGDAAHEAGMSFIAWFAPEDVLPGNYIAQEHPEWVIYPGIQEGAPGRNEGGYGMFDLGIPEAREYMTEYLKTVIREYAMDCLRVDRGWFGGPLPCWRLKDTDPDRIGISEIRGVEGLYRMWDDILAEFPHLYIDNCAGGGRRVDLETCARSIPLWITDETTYAIMPGARSVDDFNTMSVRNQVMVSGLNRYLPLWATGAMGTLPYWFRSAFNAGISFCEDIRPDDYLKGELRAAIAEAKRIRKYYLGDYYPLSELSTSSAEWCVMQYHRPDEGDGIVLAFRRHEASEDVYACTLRAIDPDATYVVAWYDGFGPSGTLEVQGWQLRNLELWIAEQPGSCLVEYRRTSDIE